MRKAQGSLEYMVIIAVVLAIAGITTLFMSGLLSGQSSQVSAATCKQASQTCELSKLSSPNDPCLSCNTACQNPSTKKEIFTGAIYCCNHTRSELIYTDSAECAALVCHNNQLDPGEQCDDGFDSACPGDCVDCHCQCAPDETLCPGIGCRKAACSGITDCGALPLPTNCISSVSCVNPGDPCNSYCAITYKSTGASCGSPTYTYYCSSSSTRCTITTSRTCNAAHSCVSSSSTTCASCSPNCCLGTPPSAYCGTCVPNCGIITCSGSTPVCCTFPSYHCCASACGAFGGCS